MEVAFSKVVTAASQEPKLVNLSSPILSPDASAATTAATAASKAPALSPTSSSKVISATEVRHTERLVCKFSISRIHSQLRRLTRESSFTPDVLLTAIPFTASRVFFAFDADQQLLATPGSTRKSPPISGLYTGVHGPVLPASASMSHQQLSTVTASTPSQECSLPGHSAGWIMFESGMEELTLRFVQRRGYGDSLVERSDQRVGKKTSSEDGVTEADDEGGKSSLNEACDPSIGVSRLISVSTTQM